MQRWPVELENLVARALAAGMPSSEIYRRIRDGGLPGLDKPLSLPQRSFYRILARTRKKMAAGTLLKPDPAAPEGEGFIAMLARIDDPTGLLLHGLNGIGSRPGCQVGPQKARRTALIERLERLAEDAAG